MALEFSAGGPEETRRLGIALGQAAEPGLVVGLRGVLGAGKTQFVRAVAEGLGIADPRSVSSPTFVLVHEYEARLPVYHFDAYRLPNLQAFRDLGADEYFFGAGVCLVEWADLVEAALPTDRLDLTLTVIGPTQRTIQVAATGERSARVVEPWRTLVGAH